MHNKICLVTGGTSGIGRVAAVELARQGARVIITGRDEARGAEAVSAIKQAAGTGPGGEFLRAELSEQSAVRRLAEQVRERCDKLHVLVNNAGTVYTNRQLTGEGIERTFATNHLAPFLLTHLLHDRLRAAASADHHARVVTVSSDAHRMGGIDLNDLGGKRRYKPIGAYSNSKLANILFTAELARRWKGDGITSNCLHPGVVRTNIWSNSRGVLRLLTWMMQPFMISSERGAQTIIYLAADPEVANTSGGYFIKSREVTPSRDARDPQLAASLWDESALLTGLA